MSRWPPTATTATPRTSAMPCKRARWSGETRPHSIEQPDCGGCHAQDTCDACHGLRMPHTREFRLTGHARPGVEDIWFNGGKTCSKCHNETRRPCTACHQAMPSHGLTWSKYHRGDPKGCSCHARTEHLYGRVICELCHEPGHRRLGATDPGKSAGGCQKRR